MGTQGGDTAAETDLQAVGRYGGRGSRMALCQYTGCSQLGSSSNC